MKEKLGGWRVQMKRSVLDPEFGMPTRESYGDTSEKLPECTWSCFYQAKGCLFIYSRNILSICQRAEGR